MHQRCSLQTISCSHSLAISLFLFSPLPFSLLSSFFLSSSSILLIPQFDFYFIIALYYSLSFSFFFSAPAMHQWVHYSPECVCVCGIVWICLSAQSGFSFFREHSFPCSQADTWATAEIAAELWDCLLKFCRIISTLYSEECAHDRWNAFVPLCKWIHVRKCVVDCSVLLFCDRGRNFVTIVAVLYGLVVMSGVLDTIEAEAVVFLFLLLCVLSFIFHQNSLGEGIAGESCCFCCCCLCWSLILLLFFFFPSL